jgi:uncharacterized protein (DUF433 family)
MSNAITVMATFEDGALYPDQPLDLAPRQRVELIVQVPEVEVLLGIESIPGVCGGEPCIVRTRIPVWVLEQARRLGVSEAELLHAYPTLRAEDLANAWAYVSLHREEIDEQIRENEEA